MSDPHLPSTQTAGNQMGQSIPVNPVQAVAPIPDTSSQTLGLEDEGDKSPETSTSSLRRVMEKTVDKLGRRSSFSSKSPSKRIFSLGRNKGKESSPFENVEAPASPRNRGTPDDSPFVNPSSPTTSIRPSLNSFPLNGSMRLGTQTLIQALTAMPWTDDPENEEEPAGQDNDARLSEDEDDDKFDHRMASSIHAIHRPVARSQRRGRAGKDKGKVAQEIFMSDTEEERHYPTILSEEEDDFDPPTIHSDLPTLLKPTPSTPASRRLNRRFSTTGSMATIRVKRRAQLADKLRDIFELEGIHQVVAEIPCWLLRSVLLQGYLYLTDTYLCFFAHMPSREDQILKSGWMSKKAARTRRWVRHWFVLKNDVLSWYPSSSDPYFPHGVVDLRYTISCDIVDPKSFRLRTSQKVVRLSTESTVNRDEWIKAIRKVVFKARNQGDSVKIAIPYSAVMDIEKSSALDFSETIEVKVVDKSENFSPVDSYFFAYFQELDAALEQIRDAVRTYRSSSESLAEATVIDTTGAKTIAAFPPIYQTQDETPRPALTGFRLSSLWRPWSETTSPGRPTAPIPEADTADDFTHITKRKTSFVPFTSSPERLTPALLSNKESDDPLAPSDSSQQPTPVAVTSDHTYPPSNSMDTSSSGSSLSSWGRPSWLRIPSRRQFLIQSGNVTAVAEHPPPNPTTSLSSGGIADALTSALSSAGSKLMPDLGFSVLDSPEGQVEQEVQDKFRQAFAFDENEKVLGYFPGHLLRLFPISGRLYVSENYFCFKSSGPLALRTKMILPIRDVLSTEKSRAFYFNGYGLVVIIRGYEELFFDFPSDERRSSFVRLLETQAERVRKHPSSEVTQQDLTKLDALFLEDIDSRTSPTDDSSEEEAGAADEPGVASHMFQSTSSTFLTFKPSKPMHITCLTIGSRGDVQPYIALAKGLIADGHTVRIATHGEFKEWIESQGIEFGYVGGDPAELMRICVENGMFTVSFLKEGIMKFRGWIDDLLKTSWEACQGTDLLIESPSAMGGIHIADALEIPYFRAFTMTWTRTRAYPHAFAVPERKMGGNYNYLSYVLFDQVFWRGVAGQVNRWRRSTLGLPSTSLDKMEPNKVPFLYNFSSILVPTPLDWPEWIRVTGYWFLDDADVSAKKWTPSPELLKFIETARAANKKIVYVGFGSIVVSDPKSMTRCVTDAIVQSGVHAILSKGWSDKLQVKSAGEVAEPEIPLPKEIFPISSAPHDWLFKRIDAACHHGGAGTTGASVRAGIPTIIKPFFGDQHFWADRVEALGIGSAVRKLTVQALSDALVAATTDQKQIQRAARVGEQVRAENGVRCAIESIYRDMEYARSLTTKRRAGSTPNHKGTDDDAEIEKLQPSIQRLSLSLARGSERPHTGSSDGSAAGAASEDWSVISDPEDAVKRSPSDKKQQGRRRSLTSVMLSALPDSLTHLSTSPPTR